MPEKKDTLNKYFAGIGKRKSAIASVRLEFKNAGQIIINGQTDKAYLKRQELIDIATKPLSVVGLKDKVQLSIKVKGGGPRAQADAIRLGIARSLLESDPNLRKQLKVEGLLTRDSRIKERKKPGLKRARRAPQWQKR